MDFIMGCVFRPKLPEMRQRALAQALVSQLGRLQRLRAQELQARPCWRHPFLRARYCQTQQLCQHRCWHHHRRCENRSRTSPNL
jgi:hypothetical protein